MIDSPTFLQNAITALRKQYPELAFKVTLIVLPTLLVLGVAFTAACLVAIQLQFLPGQQLVYWFSVPFLIILVQLIRIRFGIREPRSRAGERLIAKAAQGGPREACALGMAYLSGTAGVAKDEASGRFHLEQAARAGDLEAMVCLATLLRNGIGGIRNLKEADAWEQRGKQSLRDP